MAYKANFNEAAALDDIFAEVTVARALLGELLEGYLTRERLQEGLGDKEIRFLDCLLYDLMRHLISADEFFEKMDVQIER